MMFTAACVQLRSSTDVDENIETVERLVREAVRAGADYVQTPEMTNIVERNRASLGAAIRSEQDDPAVKRFSALAAELGIVLHIGSLALKAADGKIANRALIFGRNGRVLARYDKIHLFDVDLPNGESWREFAVYHPGDRAVVVDLPWLKLGVSICYDIRFPHLYRAHAHAGAAALTRSGRLHPTNRRSALACVCSGRAQSRTAPLSFPPRRPATMPTGARPSATRSSSRPGARCWRKAAGRDRRSSSRRSIRPNPPTRGSAYLRS